MKANPYVYPFIEFKNLSDKSIRWKLTPPRTINSIDLIKLLNHQKFPKLTVTGKTTAEKIFKIFLNKYYLYGDANNIVQDKNDWIQKLNHFINQNLPISFTIHGFPFKIPNPLKTNRIHPDLGEVLALYNLKSFIENIKHVYKPGATITIVGEGGFAKFVGVDDNEWVEYRNFINQLLKDLKIENIIKIVDIADLEKNPNFEKTFRKIKSNLKKSYASRDNEIVAKVEGTIDSVLKIISTKQYDEPLLMDIYNNKINSPAFLKLRKNLYKKSLESVFNYHAYLMTRDKLNFVDSVAPHSLPLSVSPKRGRIGIFPLSRNIKRLPYHGVPVLNNNKVSIEYLIDIKRSNKTYQPVHLQKDSDHQPFFYQLV